MLRFEPDGTATLVAQSETPWDPPPIGTRLTLDGDNVVTQVQRTCQTVRVDDWSSATGAVAAMASVLGVRSSVSAPIVVEGRLWGTIIAASSQSEPLPGDSESRIEQFTELVATAIANAESKSALNASRRRIVAAADETRRLIERDLHDGTQQRLVSLGLALRAVEANLPAHLSDLRAELSGVADGLTEAVEDLQEISRGIHPAILSKGGLAPALRALAHRSTIPVNLDITADVRLAEPIEVAAYFVASEALANASKHSQASHADLSLAQRDGRLMLSVGDDGVGGADPTRGSGLVGLADRVAALGGAISVDSRQGAGTRITAELPVELEAPQDDD